MLAIVILVLGSLALKVYWDYGQTESDKRKAYIMDLQHDQRLIKAGINPSTMQAYGLDRSHDYCNALSPCDGCKDIQNKNLKLNNKAWAKYNLKEK